MACGIQQSRPGDVMVPSGFNPCLEFERGLTKAQRDEIWALKPDLLKPQSAPLTTGSSFLALAMFIRFLEQGRSFPMCLYITKHNVAPGSFVLAGWGGSSL